MNSFSANGYELVKRSEFVKECSPDRTPRPGVQTDIARFKMYQGDESVCGPARARGPGGNSILDLELYQEKCDTHRAPARRVTPPRGSGRVV